MNPMYERTVLLIGEAAFARLQKSRVAVAGLGGVGGHCAEALARAGVGRLHLIDFDRVSPSNLNRQIVATKATLGMQKTSAMAARIAEVSDCAVTASEAFLSAETVDSAVPPDVDFLVDAIDSVPGKLALALFAHAHGIPMVCCLGAGNRLDPAAFDVRDVYETTGCPLARRMRQGLKKLGIPALPVVFSSEPPHATPNQTRIGSLAPVTAAAGLCAAGYALRMLIGSEE